MRYVNVTKVFTGTDGNTYINTSESFNNHGDRRYMAIQVPEGTQVHVRQQLAVNQIFEWNIMAESFSPYKKSIKAFNRTLCA